MTHARGARNFARSRAQGGEWLAVVLGLAAACGTRVSDDAGTSAATTHGAGTQVSAGTSTTGDATTGVTSWAEGDASHGTSNGGSGSSGGSPPNCELRNPEFSCDAPIDCSAAPSPGVAGCGAHHVFDLDGCMRPWCHVVDDCGEGELCYRPTDCDPSLDPNGCSVSEIAACSQNSQGDCFCQPFGCPAVGWCIPAAERPC